ncbi:MAG: hypothetical protein B6U76_02645 [Desulfurococcales archaeon ex4484_217_2]|nr:MAG: hypothetical protein B6U76_02645 [Desulfurococcales archaeon ex4484_217_2]
MNLTIGLQYAFSVFVIPFQETYGWSRAEIALGLTISVSILNVGLGSGILYMSNLREAVLRK